MPKSFETLLLNLSDSAWDKVRESTAKGRPLFDLDWHHNKYYRENPPDDGWVLQCPKIGHPEVPYFRKLFYPSPKSRFSLGDISVAFFSSDFAVNCCETIPQFSNDDKLSRDTLIPYLQGQGNPTPGWVGYPIHVKISPESMLLDVTGMGTPIMTILRTVGTPEDTSGLRELFDTRDDMRKRQTQMLSIKAQQHGFDGLVYQSVRTPTDITICGWNLVMFTRKHVFRDIKGSTVRSDNLGSI